MLNSNIIDVGGARNVFVALLLGFIVILSIAQGVYTLDPHHWGLMLSNASDLASGKSPYKEIFIQYGILTTVIQSIAFMVGGNLLSIIAITSLCYAIGLWGAYLLSKQILVNINTPLFVIAGLFLLHPLAIYPWANYIACPFLFFGVYVTALIYIVLRLIFWNEFPIGIAPLIIGFFFMFGLLFVFIGFLGEYIGSIHTYVRNRPIVVEKERINF